MNWSVYVPRAKSPAGRLIAPKSGCVGSFRPYPDTLTLEVDYEGNLYNSQNLKRYANRVASAAGRQATHYPTVARIWADPKDFVLVGMFDDAIGEIDVHDQIALEIWLDMSPIPIRELQATGFHFGNHNARDA